MKVWIAIISFFVLLLAFGCGGGGPTTTNGGNNGGNNGGGGTIVRYAVEALKNGTIIDPTNIIVGETVQFQVAGYTASNQRIVQSSSGWVLDPTGESEGSITSGGLFTATASGGLFTVSATAAGSVRTGPAQVKPSGQAIVTGKLINGQGGFPVGAKVDFFDSGNVKVGTSTVQSDGTFRASVPGTATTFEVNKTSIPIGYYKQYRYLNKWYLPQGACRAPLPALTLNATTPLGGDVLVPPTSANGSSLPPPPPPSPCS